MTDLRILRRMAARAAITGIAIYIASSGLSLAEEKNNAQAPTSSTQNVNVLNTPTVNVGTLPAVNVAGTPTVNVATLPAVTIGPGPLTNVGRLPSKQVMLASIPWSLSSCATKLAVFSDTGNPSCFDMNQYPGQILVVTDVEWYASTTAGNTCFVGAGFGNSVFASISAAASDGYAAKSEHWTTGVKMTGTPQASSNCSALSMYLQGYLLPNQ
jgi:hypothetical protein